MPERKSNPRKNSTEGAFTRYSLISPGMPADPRIMSQNDKNQLIQSLNRRKVNTITELRRIEKVFADMNTSEITQPMTAAWKYYVDSHNMLNELRGLTPKYPFSSECLDEAKRLVISDPNSARSWNFCWLILIKIATNNLVVKHARALAGKQSTWGHVTPTAANVDQLIAVCSDGWNRALRQMLRHWDNPPTITGQ